MDKQTIIAALCGFVACVPFFLVLALRYWIGRMERPLEPGKRPPGVDYFSERC